MRLMSSNTCSITMSTADKLVVYVLVITIKGYGYFVKIIK